MEKQSKERKYYTEINIARGIAVLCVCLGHSFPDADLGIKDPIAIWIHNFMYSFHMGCFFLLSGFVSSRKLVNGNLNLKVEIIKKVKRLLVPYLSYSFITLVLKQIFMNFANHKFDMSQIWEIVIGKNPNGGLWFLWCLFIISIMFSFISKLNSNPYVFAIIGLILYLSSYFILNSSLYNVTRYSIFYAIGILINKYYEKIKNIYRFKILIPISLITLILLVTIGDIDYFITCLLGTYCVLAVSYVLSFKHNKLYNIFDRLGSYSYDIYLISYFVQIPIRVIFWTIVDLSYWIVVSLMFILGTILPLMISRKFVRNIPITNALLLGNFK